MRGHPIPEPAEGTKSEEFYLGFDSLGFGTGASIRYPDGHDVPRL